MKPTLTEQLTRCDSWLAENKPVEWPSMRVWRCSEGISRIDWVAGWTRGNYAHEMQYGDDWSYIHVLRPGHWSTLEFSFFVYGITGVSRICTHELVRHRQMSFMQESTRAVPEPGVIVVPSFDLAIDEAARYETLGQTSTSILVAGNGRAWAEMLRKRLCRRAAPEIRWLAWLVACDLKAVAPLVYACAVPDCERCEEQSCS